MYRHYVVIDCVKYTFNYSKSVKGSPQDYLHPEDDTFYLLDLGDTDKEFDVLDGMFELTDEGYIVPKECITTFGVEPCKKTK